MNEPMEQQSGAAQAIPLSQPPVQRSGAGTFIQFLKVAAIIGCVLAVAWFAFLIWIASQLGHG